MNLIDLRIGLDIDQCICDFINPYKDRFNTDTSPKNMIDHIITRNVYKIRHDKEWWVNLPKIRDIDFIPELYCTKRVNNKEYTLEWLRRNQFPIRPIYQMVYQHGNKARMIKGRVDVFIDDSIANFEACNNFGVFTLLLTTEYNLYYKTDLRIDDLNYWEIVQKYLEYGYRG